MSRLKVILRGAQISEVGLSPEREYIAGRKENCDIRLQPEKGISREHFSLKFEDGKWRVKSLSRFGEIYSLGQRVESVVLEHGQAFQVPPYEFNYVEVAEQDSREVSSGLGAVSESEKTVVGVTQQIPYIKMLSSRGDVREMLRLEFGEIWVAGRDSSCQIIIPDQRVSRRQFEIRKINGIYTITDMDSVNGTFLNGTPVSSIDPLPLKSGDAITVLDNTMYFELHDPNFQYRMERIEIPPLRLPDERFSQTNEAGANEEILDQIEGDYPQPPPTPDNYTDAPLDDYAEDVMLTDEYPPQLNAGGGPFTGMPSSRPASQNQYYSFQHSDPPAPVSAYKRFIGNKPLLISAVLVFLGGMYYLSELINGADNDPQAPVAGMTDSFAALTPKQQSEVKELYESAQALMLQQKYSLAKENLDKIHMLLPNGYKDSKLTLDEAVASEQAFLNQKQDEKDEAEREAREETIKKTIAECEKLLTPIVTKSQMDNCLAPAVVINATHPDVVRLSEAVRKLDEDKAAREALKMSYENQVKELGEVYAAAEKIRKEGYPYRAIKAYNLVLDSQLPDPKKLKRRSTARIKFIQDTIKKRTEENLKNSEAFMKDGNLKFAIRELRGALVYDPDNRTLQLQTEKFANDLRLQAMALYQESIIDESFGYVEGSDIRPGAKDKWKKIMDMDLEDGEYYRKAYVKLKKYGVF